MRYIYDDTEQRFTSPLLTQRPTPIHELLEAPALTPQQQKQQERLFGSNAVDIEVPPVLVLLYKEVLTPFYIFQVLAIILFYFEDYYYYAGCIFVLSAVSAAMSLNETRRNLLNLRRIAALQCSVALVPAPFLPSGKEEGDASHVSNTHSPRTLSVDARTLVPGDIIVIDAEGGILPCDAVLIRGSCLVNESMLTGGFVRDGEGREGGGGSCLV